MATEIAALVPAPQADSDPGATLIMAKGYLDGSAGEEALREDELQNDGFQSSQAQSVWDVIEKPPNGENPYKEQEEDAKARTSGEAKPHHQHVAHPQSSVTAELVSGHDAAPFRHRSQYVNDV